MRTVGNRTGDGIFFEKRHYRPLTGCNFQQDGDAGPYMFDCTIRRKKRKEKKSFSFIQTISLISITLSPCIAKAVPP